MTENKRDSGQPKTNMTFNAPVASVTGEHQGDQTVNQNNYIYNEKQNLSEAATEIQQLLEQLSESHPTDTTRGRMEVATEAIKRIESNPTLMQKILSALRAGSVQAFEQFLNHPAASFVIGVLEDWQKEKQG
jgi:hypothetical protein